MTHISVPDVMTCEGSRAKALLAAIAIGHWVRLDENGIVWRDDLDVAKAMVAFGMANAADDLYKSADDSSTDVSCTAETSRPRPVGTGKSVPTEAT